jgi:hypothetical protein
VLALIALFLAPSCYQDPSVSRHPRALETDAEEPTGAAIVEVDFEGDAVTATPVPALGPWGQLGLAALLLAAGRRLRPG